MKIIWVILLYSTSVFPLSFVKDFKALDIKDSWYTGDISKIKNPTDKDHESVKVEYKDLLPLLEQIETSKFNYLIINALERFQIKTKEELTELIYACKFKNKNIRGQFSRAESFSLKAKSLDEDPEQNFLENFKGNKRPKIYVVRDIAIAPKVFSAFNYMLSNMKICIKPDLSPKDAAATLVHELVHFTEIEIITGTFSSLINKDTFINLVLNTKGGEKEAFKSQLLYLMQSDLTNKAKNQLIKDWGKSIDIDGEIVNHKKFDHKIIHSRGYLDNFLEKKKDFRTIELKRFKFMSEEIPVLINNLQVRQNQIRNKEKFIQELAQMNIQNAKIVELNKENLKIIRNNLTLKLSRQVRKNQELLLKETKEKTARDEAQLRDHNWKLEDSRKKLKELEVRLEKYQSEIADENDLLNILKAVETQLRALQIQKG